MAYTKTPASGLQNIKITPEGSGSVTVKVNYLGTFKKLDMAIKVRDEYRKKHGMSEAIDNELN